jgi:hypothetical protein
MSNPGEPKGPSLRANTIRLGCGNVAWPVALATMILVASGRSMEGAPALFEGSDKVIHFFVFGLLATLVLRTGAVWRRGAWRGWIAIAAVAVFGMLDEFRQSFTPGRYVEFADWASDTLGACVAVCAYLFWGGYRSLLEMPLWARRRDLASRAKFALTACRICVQILKRISKILTMMRLCSEPGCQSASIVPVKRLHPAARSAFEGSCRNRPGLRSAIRSFCKIQCEFEPKPEIIA